MPEIIRAPYPIKVEELRHAHHCPFCGATFSRPGARARASIDIYKLTIGLVDAMLSYRDGRVMRGLKAKAAKLKGLLNA